MATIIILLSAAVLLLAFGGLMAAIDAALSVTSQSSLDEMSQNGRGASALAKIAAEPQQHANTVSFLRVLSQTTAAVLVTAAFVLWLNQIWWAILAASLLMTVSTFVLVGASPTSYGRGHAESLLRLTAPLVHSLRVVLGPIAQGLVRLGSRARPGVGRSQFTSEEQLLNMVDEAAENDLIEQDDRDLIHSVFDFTDQYVRQVMVPRTDMVSVDASATMGEALERFLATGVSRMPVVDDEADDVTGVVYLKDLVQFAFRDEKRWREASVSAISRPAIFVPESMRAETLLQQMKREAVHVCLVIDEHGGISGLITLEDLIEELVGEIADEYDAPSGDAVEVAPGRYRVPARMGLDDVGDLFDIELEDDDVDSVGGLLGKLLGQIPQPGLSATIGGLQLTGGASRGRGRGLATVFVERTDDDDHEEDDD